MRRNDINYETCEFCGMIHETEEEAISCTESHKNTSKQKCMFWRNGYCNSDYAKELPCKGDRLDLPKGCPYKIKTQAEEEP